MTEGSPAQPTSRVPLDESTKLTINGTSHLFHPPSRQRTDTCQSRPVDEIFDAGVLHFAPGPMAWVDAHGDIEIGIHAFGAVEICSWADDGARLFTVKYATRLDRFRDGDYPLVCARSGRPADKFVPVEAARRAAWPWFLFPVSIVGWILSWATVDRDRLWGRLPFSTGEVGGIEATWDKREAVVILSGVHPEFVEACKHQQGTS